MSNSSDNAFDAGEYWRQRVVSGSDLSVVGHRSMGPVYNAHIYERRIEALEDMLARHAGKSVEDLRVLDIGCGSGFYTGYWQARGVRDYVGVDISEATVNHLAEKYPDYDFIHRDVTEAGPSLLPGEATFDLVPIFDVFYHIVDDEKFARAVNVVAGATASTGCVFVMDQLSLERYQMSRHVVYRDRFEYLSTFGAKGLELADSELLFHFLVPPLSGNRLIDYPAAALFKAAGYVLRISGALASRMAAALRRYDAEQRDRGRQLSNSELLVFRQAKAATGS